MDTNTNKSSFRFKNPTIISSIFIVNQQYKDFSKINLLPFEIQKQVTEPQEIESNKMGSKVIITVMTNKEINLDENTPCYISVAMGCDFLWNKSDFNDSEVKSFLKINAPALLLSYIRPHITMLTENSVIPTQHIPFINFSSSSNSN